VKTRQPVGGGKFRRTMSQMKNRIAARRTSKRDSKNRRVKGIGDNKESVEKRDSSICRGASTLLVDGGQAMARSSKKRWTRDEKSWANPGLGIRPVREEKGKKGRRGWVWEGGNLNAESQPQPGRKENWMEEGAPKVETTVKMRAYLDAHRRSLRTPIMVQALSKKEGAERGEREVVPCLPPNIPQRGPEMMGTRNGWVKEHRKRETDPEKAAVERKQERRTEKGDSDDPGMRGFKTKGGRAEGRGRRTEERYEGFLFHDRSIMEKKMARRSQTFLRDTEEESGPINDRQAHLKLLTN